MPSIKHSFKAKCSPALLWSVLADLESVGWTNPLVSSVEIIGDNRSGLGAVRRCRLRPKGSVTERVCAYVEGRAIGLEVVESDWPIISMAWRTDVAPHRDGAQLDQVLDYQMKFGPLGWFLNVVVLRRMIAKNVGEALKGVIRVAENQAQARQ